MPPSLRHVCASADQPPHLRTGFVEVGGEALSVAGHENWIRGQPLALLFKRSRAAARHDARALWRARMHDSRLIPLRRQPQHQIMLRVALGFGFDQTVAQVLCLNLPRGGLLQHCVALGLGEAKGGDHAIQHVL